MNSKLKLRITPTVESGCAPFVRTLRRGAYDPNCWVRDVHEEGIEPHPGPWFITKNINGMNNKKRQWQLEADQRLPESD